MTEEILEVASAAIQRLKRFAEDEEEKSDDTLELELEPTNYGGSGSKRESVSDIELDSDR